MNFNEIMIVVMRSFVSLIVLFLITKMLGKKQVSQLSMFDYVIGISIGNFAAEITINLDAKLTYGIVAVLIFGLVAMLISYITMKSIKLRRFFMGTPTIIIDKGQILESGLKKVHFDINDLLEECRGNGYFDVSEIEYAIMECSGKVSILPKSEYKPATTNDLKIKIPNSSLCANVIIDGKIMPNNLKNMNKSTNWLMNEIKKTGYKSIDNILLATLDNSEKVTIYKKSNEKFKNILE